MRRSATFELDLLHIMGCPWYPNSGGCSTMVSVNGGGNPNYLRFDQPPSAARCLRRRCPGVLGAAQPPL